MPLSRKPDVGDCNEILFIEIVHSLLTTKGLAELSRV